MWLFFSFLFPEEMFWKQGPLGLHRSLGVTQQSTAFHICHKETLVSLIQPATPTELNQYFPVASVATSPNSQTERILMSLNERRSFCAPRLLLAKTETKSSSTVVQNRNPMFVFQSLYSQLILRSFLNTFKVIMCTQVCSRLCYLKDNPTGLQSSDSPSGKIIQCDKPKNVNSLLLCIFRF